MLEGKTVLVTGAGGSIGSEVCRQLVGANIILFEQSEYALYRIHAEVGGTPVLGSCADGPLVAHTFARHRPALVIHAAAYKHVPMLEGENAFTGVRNNVLGTLYTARHTPGRYLLVSTDKAVNPSCIMGASKRLCEHIASELGGGIVRFGNVAGSAGSVIPRFREQIERGGPVTVTHPDVERFFMSIPQAVKLILAAAEMPAATYMLEMGKPLKILDLARQMIAESGRKIPIEFIGLRLGEKISEEIHYPAERKVATSDASIYALHGHSSPVTLKLKWLERGFASYAETRRWLCDILPECRTHLSDRKLTVVENARHADSMGEALYGV